MAALPWHIHTWAYANISLSVGNFFKLQDVNKSAGKDFGGNLFLTKLAGGIGYFAHIDANKDIFRNTDKVIDKIKAEVRYRVTSIHSLFLKT